MFRIALKIVGAVQIILGLTYLGAFDEREIKVR